MFFFLIPVEYSNFFLSVTFCSICFFSSLVYSHLSHFSFEMETAEFSVFAAILIIRKQIGLV